jgi:hypothetical protein
VSITVSKTPGSTSICLFYNRNEFDDVVLRESSRLKLVPLREEAKDYLPIYPCQRPSGGCRSRSLYVEEGQWCRLFPVSLTNCLWDALQVYYSQMKHKNIKALGEDHIVLGLNDEEKSFGYFIHTSLGRSFTNREDLPTAAADILREVLTNQQIPRDLNREGVRLCYERGWLHSEPLDSDAKKIVCIFPSKLHAKYVFSFYCVAPC